MGATCLKRCFEFEHVFRSGHDAATFDPVSLPGGRLGRRHLPDPGQRQGALLSPPAAAARNVGPAGPQQASLACMVLRCWHVTAFKSAPHGVSIHAWVDNLQTSVFRRQKRCYTACTLPHDVYAVARCHTRTVPMAVGTDFEANQLPRIGSHEVMHRLSLQVGLRACSIDSHLNST